MGAGYLIDTNIAIYYLNNQLPGVAAIELDKYTLSMSVISRIELLAWKNASATELDMIQAFIKSSTIYNLDESIILKSIEIRKDYSIKLPDAIIAATALVYNYTLVTRNIADFKKIPSFNLLNPWDIE